MEGVLIVDKPQGLTSHDVVAAARRLLGERRIGHTGTLDPLATGVLPLAIGRATRLVRFLAASDKEYDATIRFGVTTDSYDMTGVETSRTDATPSRHEVLRALATLTGEYRQTPPAYSAKKIGGRRAYALARDARSDPHVGRGGQPPLPATLVRVDRADLREFANGCARVTLTCSAGFYVRAFAHDLGDRVGTGACLEALRRTRAGELTLEAAIRLEELQDRRRVAERLVPLQALLGTWPAVTLTDRGRERAAHGRALASHDYSPPLPLTWPLSPEPLWIRLLDERGALVAMATRGTEGDSLHPAVVLI
jgi:tRNA pseudouridine55 synthase